MTQADDAQLLRVQSLAARGLAFAYRERAVLENLSVAFGAGEFIVIVGPNGCGKSTLLKLLVGALPAHAGDVCVDGVSMQRLGRIGMARRIALVPQMAGGDVSAATSAGFTVKQTVLMARYAAHVDESKGMLKAAGGLGIFGFETPQDESLAEQAMWTADVHHLADRPADALSGGERQRVAIARALAQQTPVLLLDEPTSALDLFHQLELIAHLRQLAQAGRMILLVTHDLNLAAQCALRVLVMDNGGIVADGAPDAVLVPSVLEPVYHVRVRRDADTLRFERKQEP